MINSSLRDIWDLSAYYFPRLALFSPLSIPDHFGGGGGVVNITVYTDSIPSSSILSALTGLVGELEEDFLPLRPEIIAIEDSLPIARTAFPVFCNVTQVQCP